MNHQARERGKSKPFNHRETKHTCLQEPEGWSVGKIPISRLGSGRPGEQIF